MECWWAHGCFVQNTFSIRTIAQMHKRSSSEKDLFFTYRERPVGRRS
jgi:hypothetical protein